MKVICNDTLCDQKNMLLVDNPTSTYDMKYAFAESQPKRMQGQAVWGLRTPGPGADGTAGFYGFVVVSPSTRLCRKSEGGFKDANTELYGTSPYLGRGDGEVFYMNESNNLMRKFESSQRGTKSRDLIDKKSFIPYTWYKVDVPLAAQRIIDQAGVSGREPLEYYS
jgi:hypothetical protein